MNLNVSMKDLNIYVLKHYPKKIEVKWIVQSSELLNQEFLRNMGGNDKSRSRYVDWMIRQVPKNYLGFVVKWKELQKRDYLNHLELGLYYSDLKRRDLVHRKEGGENFYNEE